MRIEECSFCSSKIYPGHGIQFVRNDCTIFKFCRSKCHKMFKKRRNPRKLKWTKAYRESRNKDLTEDSVIQLQSELKTGIKEPVKYSRELWNEGIEAIKTLDKIKLKRQSAHITKRLKKGIEDRRKTDIRHVEESMHMIRSPAAPKLSLLDTLAEVEKVRKKNRISAKSARFQEKVEIIEEEIISDEEMKLDEEEKKVLLEEMES
ncbi:hypothetical protein SNEBB_010520 [Seison nebaliae]|nr:hypothetical protein SNEBB_010520 [Seison nebaliae]